MTIDFHSEARKELFNAASYYEDQVIGLGDEFIEEIEKVLEVIRQQPDSGVEITENERRFLVPRFPFAIIYSKESKQIIIFAIMHLRRKPGYWKSRT